MTQPFFDDLVIECGMAPQSYFWEWDHYSQWQFRFLTNYYKLRRDQNFLDLGCGAMRLGHLLVPYLEEGRYAGIDAIPEYVEFGHRLMALSGISKKYQLVCSNKFDFEQFDLQFDVAFAQSVLGHLSLEENERCFKQLKNVMRPGAEFIATVSLVGSSHQRSKAKVGFLYNGSTPFCRPLFRDLNFLKQLCEDLALGFEEIDNEFSGQPMIKVTF